MRSLRRAWRRGDQHAARRSRPLAGGMLVCVLLLSLVLGGCALDSTTEASAAAPTATPAPPTPAPTPALPAVPRPALAATAAYLVNPATGQVYFDVNGDKQLPMASTTKIMTALVALSFAKPDLPVTVGADAVALNTNGNSVAFLVKGDVIPLSDLLYGLLLPSGDDAALAIADAVAGSEERFVGLMNLEAAILGLHHTHFVNVTGLDPDSHSGHYTTASDLARLTLSAMNNPSFATVVGKGSFTLAANAQHHRYTWTTTNELLSPVHFYSGVTGVKTGHTGDAGYCLVMMAERPAGQLLGVVLGENSDDLRFGDAIKLLNYGFQVEQKQAA